MAGFFIVKFYQYIQILSIDVVAGACITSLFISEVLSINVSYKGILCLAICVWLIYTVDHIRDGKRTEKPSSKRHQFHKRYAKLLLYIVGVISVLGVFLLPTLHPKLLIYGVILLLAVGVYFTLISFTPLKNFKEPMVALLYTFGVLACPLSVDLGQNRLTLIAVGSFIFFAALINLLFLSLKEFEQDIIDGHASMVVKLGKGNAYRLLLLILILNVFPIIYLVTINQLFLLVFGLMELVLALLTVYSKRFNNEFTYRFLGDAVFVIPIVYFLV